MIEAKNLVKKIGLQDSEVPQPVKKVTDEFRKEIVSLKKEIAPQIDEVLLGLGELPILDNRKIVKVITEKDLDKLLSETKEAIKERDIEMALEKISEVEKIFVDEPTSEPEEVTKEKESVPAKATEDKIEKKEEIKTLPLEKIPQPNFKTDLQKEESSFKTDIIKE